MSKKFGYSSVFLSLAVAGLVATIMTPARAFPPFFKEFQAKYVKADSKDEKDIAFAKAVDGAKCAVCHAGPNKKVRNDYGKQVAKLLNKGDQKNATKIQESLDKVAAIKSNAKDPKAPTYGDKIAGGKLPSGK